MDQSHSDDRHHQLMAHQISPAAASCLVNLCCGVLVGDGHDDDGGLEMA